MYVFVSNKLVVFTVNKSNRILSYSSVWKDDEEKVTFIVFQ